MNETEFPYSLVDRWIGSFPKLLSLGPVNGDSLEFHRIYEFRQAQHRRDAPYLLEKNQISLEMKLKLEERSVHFALERAGEIIACVRATPGPFELSALASELQQRSANFINYFEFSRLCIEASLLRKSLYGQMLVVKAAQHIFQNQSAEGIIGVCRLDRLFYLNRLGLEAEGPSIPLSARNGEYQFIAASKQKLLQFYFPILQKIHEKELKKISPMEVPHEY